MKSLFMTAGIFLCLCGGEFLHIGSAMLKTFRVPVMPDALPYVLVAIGAGLIFECALRTSPS